MGKKRRYLNQVGLSYFGGVLFGLVIGTAFEHYYLFKIIIILIFLLFFLF